MSSNQEKEERRRRKKISIKKERLHLMSGLYINKSKRSIIEMMSTIARKKKVRKEKRKVILFFVLSKIRFFFLMNVSFL